MSHSSIKNPCLIVNTSRLSYLGKSLKPQKVHKPDVNSANIANVGLVDGIVYVICKDNIVVELKDLENMLSYVEKICGSNKYPFIVDTGLNSKISSSGRQYMADKFRKFRTCEALICRTFYHRLLAQLYITVSRPRNPVKVFSSIEDAEKWVCASFVKE